MSSLAFYRAAITLPTTMSFITVTRESTVARSSSNLLVSEPVMIYNNTVYNCAEGITIFSEVYSSVSAANNLLVNNGTNFQDNEELARLKQLTSARITAAHLIVKVPPCATAATHDFYQSHLAETFQSKIRFTSYRERNNTTALPAPYNVDILGNIRPQNNFFDFGAYEFGKKAVSTA